MNSAKIRQWAAIGISFLVSFGAIYLMFREVDLRELLNRVDDADWRYMLGAIAVYPLSMAIRAWRWQLLFNNRIDYWRGLHIVNVGYLLNQILPFRVGEFSRILLMSREPQQSVGTGLSAVTVERLFDLMMALLCVGIGLALAPKTAELSSSTLNSLGFFVLVTAMGIIVVLLLPRTHPFLLRLGRKITDLMPEALGSRLYNFAEDSLHSLDGISNYGRLARLFLLSAATWATYVSFFFIGLYGFFESPPLTVGFLVTGFVAVGIAAPSLPGAVGVFQAAAILALRTAGYDTTIATGYAWVVWITQTIVILLGGIAGLSALSLSLGGLTEDVRTHLDNLDGHPSGAIPPRTQSEQL